MYFIIREAKCNDNQVYARSFALRDKGYKDLEEAKNALHKLNEIEKLEALQDEQTLMLEVKLNDKQYEPPKADGYHHVNVIVTIRHAI